MNNMYLENETLLSFENGLKTQNTAEQAIDHDTGFNLDVVDRTIRATSAVCQKFFGSDYDLEESELKECVINGAKAEDFPSLSKLVQKIERSPVTIKRYAVILIAGEFHDRDIEEGSYFIEIKDLNLYTHWWLIGVAEIRRIISLPEVEATIRTLHLVSKEDMKVTACPHNSMRQRAEISFGKEFDLLYQDCSWERQKEYGVEWGNLHQLIMEGKDFYPCLPEPISYTLTRFPDLAAVIRRQIAENVDLLESERQSQKRKKKARR